MVTGLILQRGRMATVQDDTPERQEFVHRMDIPERQDCPHRAVYRLDTPERPDWLQDVYSTATGLSRGWIFQRQQFVHMRNTSTTQAIVKRQNGPARQLFFQIKNNLARRTLFKGKNTPADRFLSRARTHQRYSLCTE